MVKPYYDHAGIILDKEGQELFTKYKWNFFQAKPGFVYLSRFDGKKSILFHRELMSAPPGFCVDHINGNTFDNRKTNLRLCSRTENRLNSKVKKNSKTGFKGVVAADNKWAARIYKNNQCFWLGRFSTKEEAAKAYDEKAQEFFGEFARFNLRAELA